MTNPKTGQVINSKRMMLMASKDGGVESEWEELKPVTKKYNVVTKQRIGEIADPLCDTELGGKWPVDAVGSLNNSGGGRFLLSMNMGKSILLGSEQETIENRLFILDDYRGGSAITVVVASVRLFCMNQFPLIMNTGKNKMSFPHIGEPDKMLELRMKIEEAAMNQREDAMRLYEQLMQIQISQEQMDSVLEVLYPSQEEEPEMVETARQIETAKLFKPNHVSDELLNYTRGKANDAEQAWQLHKKRVNLRRLAVVDLFNQRNEEFGKYDDTAYAFLNKVYEFADWRDGRGKEDRAMQTLVRGRAWEKRKAFQMVTDMFGLNKKEEK
jgi:hypothetical protein